MVHPHLISAILTEPWAISEEAVIGLSHIVSGIFNPDIAFEAGTPTLPRIHAVASPSAGNPASVAGAPVGGSKQIQVINISGPLMKNDQYCGPAGMKSMGQWIQEADRNPAIDGILLVIDSPGGTVSGTEELGAIIKGTQKPIIAFVEDMACSAAYWLASCADEIIANNSTAQVGSIGVLLSFMDVQPALEKQGVVFHTITAPQSTEKTSMFDKIRSGDYEEYKNTVLAPLASKFIDTVKANRATVEETQTTGAVFFSKDVTGSLVDSIATFDEALQRVAGLATPEPNSLQPKHLTPSQNTMQTPELKRLATAAGVESFESQDGSITLTAELAEAVESALELSETAMQNMQLQIDQHTSQDARVTELEGELAEAQARVIELSKEAGADSAVAITETDDEDQSPTGGFWSRFNTLKPKNK
jgi:signal peptide peptidase SppA